MAQQAPALLQLQDSGVISVSVNLLLGKAEVQFNPDKTGPRNLIQAVEDAGFDAGKAQAHLGHIPALHDVSSLRFP